MFYWKEQPTGAFIEANAEAEHHKATRVVMTRAKLVEPSAGAVLLGQLYSYDHECGIMPTSATVIDLRVCFQLPIAGREVGITPRVHGAQ